MWHDSFESATASLALADGQGSSKHPAEDLAQERMLAPNVVQHEVKKEIFQVPAYTWVTNTLPVVFFSR